MKQSEYIRRILEEKNILKYKIISVNEKSFVFKYSFGKISTEETDLNKINVFFSTQKGVSKIVLSSTNTNESIKSLIEDAIEKIDNNDVLEMDNDFENLKLENKIYNEFDKSKYLKWLKSEVDKISQTAKISANFLYTINLNSYDLLINKNHIKQYHKSSECICFESQSFQKKAVLNEVYLNDNLHEKILEQFNSKNPIFSEIDFNLCKKVLIRAEAFATLLNIFIQLFYANNVYIHGTVKTNDINEQIFKSRFDLISLPYDGILFDSEGNKTSEKFIIQDGRLLSLISNKTYDKYLKINSSGNADLNETDNVCHQRIKFIQKQKTNYSLGDADIVIESFENIYLDFNEKLFVGLVSYLDKSKNKCLTSINLGAEKLFDKIFCAGENKWVENVYCSDVWVCLK
jgi:hypothetical protein